MKKTKAFISLFLSLVMVLSLAVPTFAAGLFGGDDCDCGHAPIIQVRGIGETLYDGDGNEIFSTENIINGILPVIPDLASYLITQDINTFVNAAATAVTAIFKPVMYDTNAGRTTTVTVKKPSQATPYEALTEETTNISGSEKVLAEMAYEELGDGHSYFFTYDWTANPFAIADELNTFIEEVKEKSGHSKVSICAESMGGAIVNIYLSRYPLAGRNIENLVMSNSAFNGLEMMGQLFTGNVQIDGAALAELIVQEITSNPEYEALLPYSLLFEQLALMANDIMTQGKDQIYKKIMIPVFACIPSFWVLVPQDYYEDAVDYLLNGMGGNLMSIVNNYKTVIAGTEVRINIAKFAGMSYYNVSNYNRYIAPVTPSAKMNSDGVIETKNTSAFATVADMEMTLDDTAENNNYIQAISDGYNRISPDRVIDASTCWHPDQTWFIKNLGHIAYDKEDGTGKFYIWLLTANEQYTVRTSAEYPQFMYYDTEIPELMTYQEHLDKENGDDGAGSLLPDFNFDDVLGAITGGIESILGSLGGLGGEGEGGIDIGGILGGIDLGGILGGLGDIGGMLGGVGDLLGGLLGGGGSGSTEAPEEEEEEEEEETLGDSTTDAPSSDTTTPSTPSTPSVNTGNTGSNQTTGGQSNGAGTTVEHESTYGLWMALLIAIAVIIGILLIVL